VDNETVEHPPSTVPGVETVVRRSDPFGDLAAAMARAQAKTRHPSASALNTHFRNRYAPLAEVLDSARPLAEEGVATIPTTHTDLDGAFTLTVLYALGEQWCETDLRIPAGEAQTIGSVMTYARRYLIQAVAGVATGDTDDDGEAATRAPAPVVPIGKITAAFAGILRENAANDGATAEDIAEWVRRATDGRTDLLEEVVQSELGALKAVKEAWLAGFHPETAPPSV
jgi:hypothetical protein